MLPELKDGIVYRLPKVVYRMFDYTDVPEVSSFTLDPGTVCFIVVVEIVLYRMTGK